MLSDLSNTQVYGVGAGIGVTGSATFLILFAVSAYTLTRQQSKWSRATSLVGMGAGVAGAVYASGLESSFMQANFDAHQVNKAAKDFLEMALSLAIKGNLPLLGLNIEIIAKGGFSCVKSVFSSYCPSFFRKEKDDKFEASVELGLMEEGSMNEITRLLPRKLSS